VTEHVEEPAEFSADPALVYVPTESDTDEIVMQDVDDDLCVPIAATSTSPAATLFGNDTVQVVLVHEAELLWAIPGIVNVADAVSVPPSLPVAATEYVFGESDGTVNVQLKVPVAEVVCEVQVWVPGVTPLNVKVLIDVLGVKPEPVTDTPVVPAAALLGDRTRAGVVIV